MSRLLRFVLLPLAAAQFFPAVPHLTSFNSSFAFTQAQIASAEIGANLTETLQNIINFDRSQLAFVSQSTIPSTPTNSTQGGPNHDTFYTPPPVSAIPPPGTLLSLQSPTDPTPYTVPPLTALSRLLYTTQTYNGTTIPTSGFLLLPYLPRPVSSQKKPKIPLVIWTHGTSGFFAPSAPSSNRGLWYETSALYPLVEAGYAVFAPDYAGLGVSHDWNGTRIRHQYLSSPAGANDALYGLLAARKAFPDLFTEEFVVAGHSQGGGVAWAVAEALATKKWGDVKGYKGTVAASPTTEVFGVEGTFSAPTVGQGVGTVFSGFELGRWLTEFGERRWKVIEEVEGGIALVQRLFFGVEGLLRKGWNETWEVKEWSRLMNVGGRRFEGPLLVLQGDEDFYVAYETTKKTVERTWEVFPRGDLEFYVARGVGHTPVLHATQVYWLKWIGERFDGKTVKKGGFTTEVKGLLPKEWYQKFKFALSLWTGLPEFQYETAAAF
ncbi:hypothetical protein OQA88_4285 [Cercophora sp. LCS_1]